MSSLHESVTRFKGHSQRRIANSSAMSGRFRYYFPTVSAVVHNVWLIAPFFGITAVALSILSPHYALSVLSIWFGILCIYVDRKQLEFTLITPLTPLAMLFIMTYGLGPALIYYDSGGPTMRGLLLMQIVGVTCLPMMILGYWIVFKDVPAFCLPKEGLSRQIRFEGPLVKIGWLLIIHELCRVLIGAITGSNDRGYAGEFIVEKPFGIWTAFGLFLQISTLTYILVPLMFKRSLFIGKCVLFGIIGTMFLFNFAAGGRGAVFTPIFLMIIGVYLFSLSRIRFEFPLFIAFLGLSPLILVMGYYRNTEAFRETELRNVFQRLSAVKHLGEAAAKGEEQRASELGRAFIGTVDTLIYEMTPSVIPHYGTTGLSNVVWVFVPYFVYRNRPVLHDGKAIAEQYFGYELVRTSIGISYPAELYRRFGWIAVPFGLFAYGMFYAYVYKKVYIFYIEKNAVLGFLFAGILMNGFVAWNFHTIPNLAQSWIYGTFLKHFGLMFILYLITRGAGGRQRPLGARQL
jgi:hypothetical protein